MTEHDGNTDDDTWKNSPFASGGREQPDTEKLGLEGLSTEEKVDRLAETTVAVAEQVERITAMLDKMADAQGTSQQSDHGDGGKVWGDDSPFGGSR